jgi:hypothetical protein
MTKLTSGQHAMLVKAAKREDGAVVVAQGAGRAGAARIVASLVARRLLRECSGASGLPVWREDERGRSVCLIVTKAGRAAVGKVDEKPPRRMPSGSTYPQEPGRRSAAEQPCKGPRAGSKQALLIEMLSKEQGATLDDMIAATGWLPHTTRAALTGLRKRGLPIERTRAAGEEGSSYRIAEPKAAAA